MLDLERQPTRMGDMDPQLFRFYGHQLIDWIASSYLAGVEHPILAQTAPGDIRRALPSEPPAQPESMEVLLGEFHRLVLPGSTHWNSGRFLGYFGLGPSAPALLGEMLASVLNPTRMLWHTSPVATELEHVTLDWLRQMLGLPAPLFGMIHPNSAVDLALVAARETLPDLAISKKGMSGSSTMPRLCCYASVESHVSVEKAAIVLGLGQEGLHKIAVDRAFRMDVAALERTIQEDLAHGWRPFAVVATVGTTSSTSIDPVSPIADVCERYGLWLHVDAAYAGAAALVPELRWVLDGCDRAHSFTLNPHKWLFLPFGCSVFYTRQPEVLKAALGVSSAYLHQPHQHSDDQVDLFDYTDKLPHRFPALSLYMVLRYFGHEGLAKRIREHCRLAQLAVQWIEASPDFELLAPTPLSVVCFRAHPKGIDDEAHLNALNERLMHKLNAAGRFFLSHTLLEGRFTLRIAVGNIRTTEEDVRDVWNALQAGLAAEEAAGALTPVSLT